MNQLYSISVVAVNSFGKTRIIKEHAFIRKDEKCIKKYSATKTLTGFIAMMHDNPISVKNNESSASNSLPL